MKYFFKSWQCANTALPPDLLNFKTMTKTLYKFYFSMSTLKYNEGCTTFDMVLIFLIAMAQVLWTLNVVELN